MATCPSCSAGIPAEHVRDGVARCHACDIVFEVVSLPDPVDRDALPEVVEAEVRWLARVPIAVHVVALLVLAGCALAMTRGLLLFVAGAALGAPIAVVYAYLFANTTTIRVDGQGLSLTYGPLPAFWLAPQRIPTSALQRARVEETAHLKLGSSVQEAREDPYDATYEKYTLHIGGKALIQRADERFALERVAEKVNALIDAR
jgi:hypothetical protein